MPGTRQASRTAAFDLNPLTMAIYAVAMISASEVEVSRPRRDRPVEQEVRRAAERRYFTARNHVERGLAALRRKSVPRVGAVLRNDAA